jgi:hypothetical protein
MKNLIPVEGRPNLYRDKNSGAIINTDTSAYQQHLKYIQRTQNERTKMETLENDVNSIKNEISELKSLVLQLVNKP